MKARPASEFTSGRQFPVCQLSLLRQPRAFPGGRCFFLLLLQGPHLGGEWTRLCFSPWPLMAGADLALLLGGLGSKANPPASSLPQSSRADGLDVTIAGAAGPHGQLSLCRAMFRSRLRFHPHSPVTAHGPTGPWAWTSLPVLLLLVYFMVKSFLEQNLYPLPFFEVLVIKLRVFALSYISSPPFFFFFF